MKTVTLTALSFLVVLAAFVSVSAARAAEVIEINDWSYGAIAYEESTGEYHYSYNCGSRAEAERMALSKCTAKDAEVLCWTNDGIMVLARDANGKYHTGFSYGEGASSDEAKSYAFDTLDRQTARTILMLTTDGQYIYKSK